MTKGQGRFFTTKMSATVEEDLDAALDNILGEAMHEAEGSQQQKATKPKKLRVVDMHSEHNGQQEEMVRCQPVRRSVGRPSI